MLLRDASCNTTNASTESPSSLLRVSVAMAPALLKCRSDSPLVAWITKTLFAIWARSGYWCTLSLQYSSGLLLLYELSARYLTYSSDNDDLWSKLNTNCINYCTTTYICTYYSEEMSFYWGCTIKERFVLKQFKTNNGFTVHNIWNIKTYSLCSISETFDLSDANGSLTSKQDRFCGGAFVLTTPNRLQDSRCNPSFASL